jgi:Dynamin GTPase effector domain
LKVCLVLSCDGDVFSLHTRIVALLRFVDYVPLVIDTVLVRGLCDDLATVLRRSFRFSEVNAAERCSYFLQESPEAKRMRDHLGQKHARLTRAAEELRRHGL